VNKTSNFNKPEFGRSQVTKRPDTERVFGYFTKAELSSGHCNQQKKPPNRIEG
jgi:hypothetical protein